jgi:hypothetical protein
MCLVNLMVYSQKLLLNNGDTLICFSVNQAKFLAKEHYRAETYFKADSICKEQIILKDRQVKMYIKIEDKLQGVINNQSSIIKFKDEELNQCKIILNNSQREIKKQKRLKIISIIVSGGLNCFFIYTIAK